MTNALLPTKNIKVTLYNIYHIFYEAVSKYLTSNIPFARNHGSWKRTGNVNVEVGSGGQEPRFRETHLEKKFSQNKKNI